MHAVLTLIGVIAAAIAILRLTYRPVPTRAVMVDGDTIKVDGVKWRLTGFDAPEWNQPGGRQATAFLSHVLRTERCYAYVRGSDAYGRPLATIVTPRGPLSWRMAFAGHAHGEGHTGTALTVVARILGRGLWSGRGRVLRPAQWRAGIR